MADYRKSLVRTQVGVLKQKTTKSCRKISQHEQINNFSECNVNLVDGLIWSQEVVSSNLTIPTKFIEVWRHTSRGHWGPKYVGESPTASTISLGCRDPPPCLGKQGGDFRNSESLINARTNLVCLWGRKRAYVRGKRVGRWRWKWWPSVYCWNSPNF